MEPIEGEQGSPARQVRASQVREMGELVVADHGPAGPVVQPDSASSNARTGIRTRDTAKAIPVIAARPRV
jgi:hypothetical protein